MCRFLQTQNLTVKKTFRSAQAATETVQQQRVDYWEAIRGVAVDNLVFLDEMGVSQGIARERGRSPKGERLYGLKPFYRGQQVTVIGAVSSTAVLAMKPLDKSLTGYGETEETESESHARNQSFPSLEQGKQA